MSQFCLRDNYLKYFSYGQDISFSRRIMIITSRENLAYSKSFFKFSIKITICRKISGFVLFRVGCQLAHQRPRITLWASWRYSLRVTAKLSQPRNIMPDHPRSRRSSRNGNLRNHIFDEILASYEIICFPLLSLFWQCVELKFK